MKSLLKLWALLVPLALMGSFGGGSFGSGSSISANGKGMQGSQGSGASAPTPDFSLYNIASGPSQLAGTATYNGTALTTVLECFGEGFTEGVGLVCATGGTWTESSDGVDDDDWPGAWSDHTNEAFEMVGSGADALLTPSPTLFDAVSGKDVFVEAVYWPDVSQNQALIDWRDRADNGQGIAIWLDSSEVVRSIADCDGTDTGAASPVGRAGTSIDAWNFASFVFDHNATAGRSISLGVNGGASSYAGDPCTGDMLNVSGVASQARIGDLTQSASTYEFEGKISYIAVRYCDGCVVDEPGGTTSEAYNAERFARLTGTYATDGADKIPSLATRASAGMACHLNDSGVRKCDQVGDNWIRTYDVADTGWDDASATHMTGILIEEERTNDLATGNGDGTATGWVSTSLNATVSTVSGCPFGSCSAWTSNTNSASYKQISDVITLGAGTPRTQSVLVKAGHENTTHVLIGVDNDNSAPFESAFFDLSNCTPDGHDASDTPDAFGYEDYGDGWCRVWIRDTPAVASDTFLLGFAGGNLNSDRIYAVPSGEVVGYVQHIQNEAGLYPSSPIVANSVAVTRSADALVYPYSHDPAGGGTLVATASSPAYNGAIHYALEVHDNSSTSRHIIRTTAAGGGRHQGVSTSAGTIAVPSSLTAWPDGGFDTVRYTYATDDFELFVNGASVSTDTSGTIASDNTNNLNVGTTYNETGHWQGVITCAAHYKDTALTDDGVCE